MGAFAKLTWVELKLFTREPFAVIFTFAFPLIVLIVLINSFQPEEGGFGGFGEADPQDYYLASYVGVVIAAVGLIALPVHIATYRDRGILRRFRASSLAAWTIVGAQAIVGLLMAIASSIALIVFGRVFYDAAMPESPGLVLIGFLVGTITFLSVGVLLGIVTRNARGAQAVGMMLFFPMFLMSGAGPPRDIMSSGMRSVSDVLPLTWVVSSLQNPWLGEDMEWSNLILLGGLLAVCVVLSMRLLRRV
jgi:ABC-2 type transport system permease protein